jgi:hypothetical protein
MEALPSSRTSQQYLATQRIAENLRPEDSSGSVLCAGDDAHIFEFEAASPPGNANDQSGSS